MSRSVEDIMREHREQLAQAAQLQRAVAGVTATAADLRRAVRVTVGARGELTALEFPTGAYRRMAPQELAALIVATATAAAERAAARVAGLAAPTLPSGLDVGRLLSGSAGVGEIFGERRPVPGEHADHDQPTTR